MKKRDYNRFDFASLVKIDDTSPSGLTWVAPRLYGGKLKYERVGTPAGNVRCFNDRQSYYMLVVFNQAFFVHRIVYLLKNGRVDTNMDIDHIDGNSLNNAVDNLREVSPSLNARNKKKKSNKELKTGIYLETYIAKSGKELQKIRAHFSFNGKVHSRSWSTLLRGYDRSLELAENWRTSKIEHLNHMGHGYTERHGT